MGALVCHGSGGIDIPFFFATLREELVPAGKLSASRGCSVDESPIADIALEGVYILCPTRRGETSKEQSGLSQPDPGGRDIEAAVIILR